MRKILSIAKNVSIISLCCAPSLPLVCLSSCSEKINITEITIIPQKPYIQPGDSVRIMVSYKPHTAKQPSIKWEIIDLPEELQGVAISSQGIITVPSTLELQDNYDIQFKGTVIGNETLTSTASIIVCPKGSSGILGFKDGVIKYLDPVKNETTIRIIKPDKSNPKKYETEGTIDLFLNDVIDPTVKPGWTSPIQFTPVMTPGTDPNMQFWRDDHLGYDNITWKDAYSDGNDTTKIPNFYAVNDNLPLSYIKVTFSGDPEVELKINFHLWQKRTQETNGRILYYPDPEKTIPDTYEIEMQGEGQYLCYLHCPIKKSYDDTQIFEDSLPYIFCFGGLKEFSDFEIIYDTSFIENEDIKNAFTLMPNETQNFVNPFDLTPYWITGFHYKFDLSKMQHTTEQLQYKAFTLFLLRLRDKWNPNPDQFKAECTFRVEWIDDEI